MARRDSWPSTRASLLLRIRDADDDEAWRYFETVYAPILRGYCRKCGLQEADGDDVVQVVLTRVQRFEYDREKGRFRDWLGTVTRNEVRRAFRSTQRPDTARGGDDAAFERSPDDASCDSVWLQLFYERILEVALERTRPEFDKATWKVFEAAGIAIKQTEEGRRIAWQRVAPQKVADRLGIRVADVYKVRSKVLRRVHAEIMYLAQDIATPPV